MDLAMAIAVTAVEAMVTMVIMADMAAIVAKEKHKNDKGLRCMARPFCITCRL